MNAKSVSSLQLPSLHSITSIQLPYYRLKINCSFPSIGKSLASFLQFVRVTKVDSKSKEVGTAKSYMFAKHAKMKGNTHIMHCNVTSVLGLIEIDSNTAKMFYFGSFSLLDRKTKTSALQAIQILKEDFMPRVPLMDRWLIIFASDHYKNALVHERFKALGEKVVLVDNWGIETTSVESISEMQDIKYVVSQVRFTEGKDSWIWAADRKNSFSVAAVKGLLRQERNLQTTQLMKWEA
ncbi:hypothetical protein M8C21_004914 [Ambrosia artemisiifolia]|uniref:Uncharacterized protein n=1 Tax=Ambrosia artemisiifolia TaxID=4212 RepID=A0AAD5CNM9_AMBAR|nr:hypothetical protein M8C21_004914 [Ambrosia artemisiifolia]